MTGEVFNGGVIPKHNWTKLYADSEEVDFDSYVGENAFDDDLMTSWITKWTGGIDPLPHELQIDLFDQYLIHQVKYLPRSVESGRVKDYAIYIADDNCDWGVPVATGAFVNGASEQIITLPTPKEGKVLKFVATSSIDGGNTTAVTELNLVGERLTPYREILEHTDLLVTIELSPDPRVTSHTLFLINIEDGSEVSFDIGMNTQYQISKNYITPNTEYAVTALASGMVGTEQQDSIRCAPFRFKVIVDPPEIFTITASVRGSGGTINPTGVVEVESGQNQTFIITPIAGYENIDIYIDGVSIGAGDEFTFTNVTADHTIEVEFAPVLVKHFINVSHTSDGIVEPSGMVQVTHGDDITFTFTPDPDRYVYDVLVDGVFAGPDAIVDASYTFTNVTEDHALHVEFSVLSPFAQPLSPPQIVDVNSLN